MHLGPRRRRRKRELSTRHLATQLIIACLNWEVLGHPVDPPPEGCLGYPISDAQHLIIEHIESLVDHHLSSGDFTEDDLGRFLEKYQGVIKMLEELPHCHSSGEDLTSVLIDCKPTWTHTTAILAAGFITELKTNPNQTTSALLIARHRYPCREPGQSFLHA